MPFAGISRNMNFRRKKFDRSSVVYEARGQSGGQRNGLFKKFAGLVVVSNVFRFAFL